MPGFLLNTESILAFEIERQGMRKSAEYPARGGVPAILYEAPDWVIINKPAGLPVQPGKAVGANLVDILAQAWGTPPFPVHRLDRDTAGCLLVARTSAAAKRMGRVLSDPGSKKTYLAIVSGIPRETTGIIKEEVIVHGVPKQAKTVYTRRQNFDDRYSLLELALSTGRMHQIRLHLASIGHPILGDDRHGDFTLNKALRRELGLKKLLLFAYRLDLPLARAGGVTVTAPFPEHFTACVSAWTHTPLS
jgi:23S rRNA pseudouridine955/2504/2580 synthase